MEMIDKMGVIRALAEHKDNIKDFSEIKGYIDRLYTEESRPKGKWIGGTTDYFQCSNCRKLSFYPSYVKVTEVEWDYCPYCGANMRGGVQNERAVISFWG